MKNKIKTYYYLAKPGIVFGNDITAIAGFFLAAKGHIHMLLFFATLIGVSFCIASACVVNNYLDRRIDAKMERTKKRALVTGAVSGRAAIIYAIMLGLIGFSALAIFTNLTTVLVGIVGMIFYIILYAVAKRYSFWSTVVGSVSGAIPPVAGYTAVSGRLDLGAMLIFLILVFWQMPHFYAIAIYRFKDYKAAHLPVLPVAKGIFTTKIHILLYTIGFALVAILLASTGFAGRVYLYGMLLLCLVWIVYAVIGFSTNNVTLWAKRMFVFSLLINLAWSLLVMTNFLFL